MNGKSKNPVIELWRVAFSLLIVACHTTVLPWYSAEVGLFKSASIGVEFFFVLSGFLMAKTAAGRWEREGASCRLGSESAAFIWAKAKSIYPTYFFALCLELLVAQFLAVPNKRSFLEVLYGIWDVLFLRLTGLQGQSADMLVGASWYLSGMILAMWILYPLLRKFTDTFLHVIAPLTAVFILGWFSATRGSIKFQLDFENGVCLGLLRAIAELCVGCACFALCRYIQKSAPRTTSVRVLATVGEIGCLGAVFVIARLYYRGQMDFISLLLIAAGVTLSFSGLSYTAKLEGRINVKWAGKFSLALYLNHVVWIRMLNRWKLPVSFNAQVLFTFALSVVTAILCVFTIDLISQLWAKKKKTT